MFLATFLLLVNRMQVRNLRNRLRVNMVCEWVWVSIPGERDLPKTLNWCSRLEIVQVRTHARTQASARTYSLLPWHSNKNKSRCTVTADTK